IVLWTLGLWAAHRALTTDGAGAWLLLGCAIGVGSLAKYAMLFAVPGLALYVWLSPERRWSLRARGPFLAASAALVTLAPMLGWNARVGGVSARHVVSQGRGSGLTLVHLAEFLGSQILVLTPIVAGLLAWGLWVGVREGVVGRREPYRFLLAFTVPVLATYFVVGLQGKLQANWAAAAYPPLALATAGLLLERRAALTAGRRHAP